MNFFLIATFLTGSTALIYQTIWQRYLSLLLGSDSKSAALIVAFFLLGLAAGYYVFGKMSSRIHERHLLLKKYGYVEIAIGFYAIIFPNIFEFIFNSSLAASNNLAFQLPLVALLVLPPTFLMGATIPMLTSALPSNAKEVARIHSTLYGLNTLGAFAGCLIGGLLLIPAFGFSLSLKVTGLFNIMVALVFVKNNLAGDITQNKDDARMSIPNNYSDALLFFIAFFSGCMSLALEILWIRLFALTIGASIVIFPLVVSLFVLGIGLGGLTLREISVTLFQKQLIAGLLVGVISLVVAPFLPLWCYNIRVLLADYPSNYYLYYFYCYSLLAIFLLPLTFFQGRILPCVYALLKKNSHNYGSRCGQLYAANTVGAFCGAVLLGHMALYVFNIDQVYKGLFIAFALLILVVLWSTEKKIRSRIAITMIALLVVVTNSWNRSNHQMGLFTILTKARREIHNPFIIFPINKSENLFFRDDPNTTVAVQKQSASAYSIFVNGKSDGSTKGDFGTVSLLALIPYFLTPTQNNLQVGIVGTGTGITAGIAGKLADVLHVDLVEISPAVLEAQKILRPLNYNMIENPKISAHLMDAFQFFKNKKKQYDFILSEPTNPWVAGVENLYTEYFYQMSKKALRPKGMLVQWLHLYNLDAPILITVMANLKKVFAHISIYQSREGDLLMLASDEENDHTIMPNLFRRADESVVKDALIKMNLPYPDSFLLLQRFTSLDTEKIIAQTPHLYHQIFFPSISQQALKTFFLGQSVNLNFLLDPLVFRKDENIALAKSRYALLKRHTQYLLPKNFCQVNRKDEIFDPVLCRRNDEFRALALFSGIIKVNKKEQTLKRLGAYAVLREAHFMPRDEKFLQEIEQQLHDPKAILPADMRMEIGRKLLGEYKKEGMGKQQDALAKILEVK